MAVKGKQIASKSSAAKKMAAGARETRDSGKGKAVSSGKRKPEPSHNAGGRSKRTRSAALKFFDDEARDADPADEQSSDDEDELDRDFLDDAQPKPSIASKSGRVPPLPFVLKEEELSDDELEKLLRQRYSRGNIVYADEDMKDIDDTCQVVNSATDPVIWRVKCMVGRERQLAFCLMQKFLDVKSLGTRLHIKSVFSIDHMKGYLYIEADRERDVIEVCRGLCSIYSSRMGLVPKNEVLLLLSAQNKINDVSEGSWVRISCGKYKGDLAQVVAVNGAHNKATIKLIPRIDLQAIALKFGGGSGTVKEPSVSAPHLISSRELEAFRPHIECRRDHDTGETYEVLDGLMLKDGYLYKKISLTSLSGWEVKPSAIDILNFTSSGSASDDSEWLSVIYGGQRKRNMRSERADDVISREADDLMPGVSENTSGTKRSNFVVHDLVFFGHREVGVIVGVGKEGFKILKGDPERQITVTVDLREIRNVICDKNFTARDSQKNIMLMNDSVKILKGPLKAREGTIKHMYKGCIFIFDHSQLENTGIFCARPELCVKIKYSRGSSDRIIDDGLVPPGFEDSKEGPSDSQEGMFQQSDSNRAFKGNSHGDREPPPFSIGQTLRIRVGPLKGHLCRVMAMYRSEVTVKLDSQSKILKVNSEHLSEAGFKSFGNITRDSVHDFSVSGFMGKPSEEDPFGAFSNYNSNDGGKDDTTNPWETNSVWGSASKLDQPNTGADSWDKALPSTVGESSAWTKAADVDELSHADKLGSWGQPSDNWDKAPTKSDVGCSSADGWEKPNIQTDQAGWNSGGTWGKDNLGSENQQNQKIERNDQRDPTKESEKSWNTWNSSGATQNDTWNSDSINRGGKEAISQDKGKSVFDDHTNSWEKERNDAWSCKTSWDAEANNQDKGQGIINDHPNSWGAGKGSSKTETDPWSKATDFQDGKGSSNVANLNDPWGIISTFKNESSGKNQTDSWSHAKGAGGAQTGASDKSEVGSGDQAAGWGSWKTTNEGKTKDWNNTGSIDQNHGGGWNNKSWSAGQSQADSWNKPKSFGGDQASNWNKGSDNDASKTGDLDKSWGTPKDGGSWKSDWNKGMMGNTEAGDVGGQDEGWNQRKSSDGGQGSGWRGRGGRGRGGDRNQEGWNQSRDSDGGRGSGWRGGRGGGGRRGRGGRSFGRGRSSEGSRDQGNHWDRDGAPSAGLSSGWSSGQASSWNKENGSDGNNGSGTNQGWSVKETGASSNRGKDTQEGWGSGNQSGWNNDDGDGGSNNSWNKPKFFGEGLKSGWKKEDSGHGWSDSWKGSDSFGQGQSSGWNKGAATDDGSKVDSWNSSKPFDGQSRGRGRGRSFGRNGDGFGRGRGDGFGRGRGDGSGGGRGDGFGRARGRRDEAGSWKNESSSWGKDSRSNDGTGGWDSSKSSVGWGGENAGGSSWKSTTDPVKNNSGTGWGKDSNANDGMGGWDSSKSSGGWGGENAGSSSWKSTADPVKNTSGSGWGKDSNTNDGMGRRDSSESSGGWGGENAGGSSWKSTADPVKNTSGSGWGQDSTTADGKGGWGSSKCSGEWGGANPSSGTGTSNWKTAADPVKNTSGGGWAKNSTTNDDAGGSNSSKNSGGWSGANSSGGTGGSNWSGAADLTKDTVGSGSQASGWKTDGKANTNDHSSDGGNEKSGWGKAAGSWSEGSGGSSGWK